MPKIQLIKWREKASQILFSRHGAKARPGLQYVIKRAPRQDAFTSGWRSVGEVDINSTRKTYKSRTFGSTEHLCVNARRLKKNAKSPAASPVFLPSRLRTPSGVNLVLYYKNYVFLFHQRCVRRHTIPPLVEYTLLIFAPKIQARLRASG